MKKTSLFLAAALLIAAPLHAAPLAENAAPMAEAEASSNAAAPSVLPAETLEKLRAILANPALGNGYVGVEIRAIGRAENPSQFAVKKYRDGAQPVVFEQNATRRFLPASNMKLYTAALALRALGENKTFATTLASTRAPQNGAIDGDLRIVGGGDPSLQISEIEALAKELVARGVRRVRGDVVGDGRAFGAESLGARYPDGWTLDDALWYYGPEVSALAVNRNQVDVTLTGAKSGQPATLEVAPPAPTHFRIRSRVVTAASTRDEEGGGSTGENGALRYERADADSALGTTLSISGILQAGKAQSEGIAVPNPPRWAAQILRDTLLKNGVAVAGVARSAAPHDSEFLQGDDFVSVARLRADALPATQVLARHESAPLGVVLRRFLKTSDNLYGEMLLRNVALSGDAALAKGGPNAVYASRGLFMMRRFLAEQNIAATDLRFTDGSGLSRYDLVTPRANTQLLAAAISLKGGATFWDALPIAGIDGTLRRRMTSTRASGNARAKTGTFSTASTLSGFVTTQDGDRLAVAVLTNFCDGGAARIAQNDIFIALADSRR